MNDKFKRLMEHSFKDAVEIHMDSEGVSPQEVEQTALTLFQMRASKYMNKWNYAYRQKVMGDYPDLDSGPGVQ